MPVGSGGPSKWFIGFCLLLGVALGLGTAAIVLSFWSVFAGEEGNRGLFFLVWMLSAVVFFAWPLQVYERARAVSRQRTIMRERIGDPDYEPSVFPSISSRAAVPKDERDEVDGIAIKAPHIEPSRFRRLLSGGRTAEQRMADYLRTLELKDEMKRAQESKEDGNIQ